MSRFLLPSLEALRPYTPGEQPKGVENYIKLNTNESPYPPAPEVRAALTEAQVSDLRLYPDPTAAGLKAALAELYEVKPQEVYLANGSDDILYFSFLAFCAGRPVVFCDLTYGFYEVFADLTGARKNIVPLREDFTVDVDALAAAEGTVFLANPNAPTGIALSPREIERLVASDPDRLVVVDEAYVDFGAQSALPLLSHYDNLLIVRTFSKSRNLAGARLGYAFGREELICDLERVRYSTNPYNVNRLTLLLGERTVEQQPYYEDCIRRICQTRQSTATALRALGFSVTDSRANFLFATHPEHSAEGLYESLKERGVLVRYFGGGRAREHLRISVGSELQMRIFLETLQSIMEKQG